jgi:hypothetical protein
VVDRHPGGVGLLAGFFSIPAGTVGHVPVGLLFVAGTAAHLATRPRPAAALWRSVTRTRRETRLRISAWTAIVAAAAMTASGFVQWAGVSGAIPVHATSSYVAILAAGVHLWQHRRVFAARLRQRAPADRG